MNPEHLVMQKKDALLIIAVQNDFRPNGALAVSECEAAIPILNNLIRLALDAKIPIFASRDWHPRDHISFRQQGGAWPPHCIQDTWGAEFHPDLELPYDTVVITKGEHSDQNQISVFDNTGLEHELRKKGIRRLVIGGFNGNMGTFISSMDALKHGFTVLLYKQAIRPIAHHSAQEVLAHLKLAGATVIEGADPSIKEGCQQTTEWAEHAHPNRPGNACDDGRGKQL